MGKSTADKPLGDIPDALMSLFKAQVRFSQDMFESVTGIKPPAVGDSLAALRAAAPKPVCYVPPPCWMPLPLGECVSYINDCGKACIRLKITNCDRVARTIAVRAEGIEGVEVSPASVQLGPMARATVEVCLNIPEGGSSAGNTREGLIWVDGCRQHYLRWTVIVGTAGLDSCFEVAVNDCPDYRHHWYDHFYCLRPCPSGRTTQTPSVTGARNG